MHPPPLEVAASEFRNTALSSEKKQPRDYWRWNDDTFSRFDE